MRVLFTHNQLSSHFHPLVPIARALADAGHQVAFASLPDLAATVQTSGFQFFPVGPSDREFRDGAEAREIIAVRDPIARRDLIR